MSVKEHENGEVVAANDLGLMQPADLDAYARECVSWISAGGENVERGAKGLFDLYAARIKSRFRRNGLNDEDAADLLQQTFVNALRGAARFRGHAKVSTWLWKIADNALKTWLRKDRTVPRGIDAGVEEDEDPEFDARYGTVDPDDEARALQDCVARGLAAFARQFPDRADAIELGVVERWPTKDLAMFLGRTEGATREFVSQCRKKLRPFLEPCVKYLQP